MDVETEFAGIRYGITKSYAFHGQWIIVMDLSNNFWSYPLFCKFVGCKFVGDKLVPASSDSEYRFALVPTEVVDYFCKCLKLKAFW